MLLRASLLFGLAVAIPTEQHDARHVDCKAVNFVVQALKISPGASKYCSNVLGIKPAQTTQTVNTVKTVTTTKTTQATVTQTTTATKTSTTTTCLGAGKRLGRAFQFAEPTNTALPKREPIPSPESSHELEERTSSCKGAPINGFACSLISSACSCLSLSSPANTATRTVTSCMTTTVVVAADPTTVSVTITATETETKYADTWNDPFNCRRCGTVCSGETSFCTAGRCIKPCVPGQDFSSDMENCGGCGMTCPSSPGYECVSGQCTYQE